MDAAQREMAHSASVQEPLLAPPEQASRLYQSVDMSGFKPRPIRSSSAMDLPAYITQQSSPMVQNPVCKDWRTIVDPRYSQIAVLIVRVPAWRLHTKSSTRVCLAMCRAHNDACALCSHPLRLKVIKKGWALDLRMYLRSPFHTLLHVRRRGCCC
jgi:hypothetical protein